MMRVYIELLDERSTTLFHGREKLEGRYPSGMPWADAAENLYNRFLPGDERYRFVHPTGLTDPLYVSLSYRTLDDGIVVDPLCRVTIIPPLLPQ